MAFKHGKAAQISVAGTEIGTFCTSLELSVEQDAAETTTFGNAWQTSLTGIPGGKFTMEGNFDPTITTGPLAVLWAAWATGAPVALIYKPGGTASGQRTYTFSANITSIAEPAEVGGLVTFSSDWVTTGAVTPTTQ
jgi:hypothetical protein